jgi:hypothetical protein
MDDVNIGDKKVFKKRLSDPAIKKKLIFKKPQSIPQSILQTTPQTTLQTTPQSTLKSKKLKPKPFITIEKLTSKEMQANRNKIQSNKT